MEGRVTGPAEVWAALTVDWPISRYKSEKNTGSRLGKLEVRMSFSILAAGMDHERSLTALLLEQSFGAAISSLRSTASREEERDFMSLTKLAAAREESQISTHSLATCRGGPPRVTT